MKQTAGGGKMHIDTQKNLIIRACTINNYTFIMHYTTGKSNYYLHISETIIPTLIKNAIKIVVADVNSLLSNEEGS